MTIWSSTVRHITKTRNLPAPRAKENLWLAAHICLLVAGDCRGRWAGYGERLDTPG